MGGSWRVLGGLKDLGLGVLGFELGWFSALGLFRAWGLGLLIRVGGLGLRVFGLVRVV